MSGDYRVLVDSIGTAEAGLISALGKALPHSHERIAELLLQAPSVLLEGVSKELAKQTVELLSTTGVEVRVADASEPFEPGVGEFELALVIREVDRLTDIISEVAKLLGCAAPQAVELVCACPAVLIGRVSTATVDALRRRFGPLGAELAVSRTADARFDVFVDPSDPEISGHLVRILDALELPRPDDSEGLGPIVATGLDSEGAKRLWGRLRGTGGPLRVLNRDFVRFDVRLLELPTNDAGEVPEELIAYLAGSTGMPPKLAARLGPHLPIVLHEDVDGELAQACMLQLAEHGAAAEAVMLSFQRFDLELRSTGDRVRLRALFQALASLELDELERLPTTIPGPFTKVRARWLADQAASFGAEIGLVPR